MVSTSEFVSPPIIELVLGVQFSPLTRLRAGHFGLFWKELGEEWTEPGDATPIETQFELFDQPRWSSPTGVKVRLESGLPLGRFTLGNRLKDRLLQIQATRFHLNWRKAEGSYPSYGQLIREFEGTFSQFMTFTKAAGIGEVAPNQWELTYIDAFPQGEYWNTPADWASILPGLFGGLFPTEGMDVQLENRAAEWSYEIKPQRGRLHIGASAGKVGEDRRSALLLQMTARGPIGKGGAANLREGLDLGHKIAYEAFLRVTSDKAKDRWR